MDDTLEVIDKILKETKPKAILEIGTAVGYSAMCFSRYLAEGGKIDTIEREHERVEEAKVNIQKVGVADKINILEGDAVEMVVHADTETPLYVELMPSVVLEVTYTEPGLKGDTASSTALKPAEVETGAKVMVPLFIEMGEKIRISTADGSYVERVR